MKTLPMKTLRSPQLLALAIVASLALSACNRSSDTTTTPAATPGTTATAPATSPAMGPSPAMESGGMMASQVTVRSINVGNTAAADRTVASQSAVSRTDPIIVSVRTDGSASNTNIGARLTHQDGQVAGEESQMLNTSGSETTNIEFRNASGWPAGRYTVDVMVDGQPAGMSQQVEVR